MAQIINMPRLSDTMEEGTVSAWLKNVGDPISEGDILAEIETDKATMEFESFYEGILLHIGIKQGETAKVDSLLAIIGEPEEDISKLLNEEQLKQPKTPLKEEEENTNSALTLEIHEGVQVISMPQLSDTMEEGTVSTWLKKIGDTIEEGDILAEIETDKATMEFESFHAGTLLYIGLQEGESAKVDDLLAILGPKGANIDEIIKKYEQGKLDNPHQNSLTEKVEKNNVDRSGQSPPGIDKPHKATPKDQSSRSERIFISPLAKKIAIEKGIDWVGIQGSGDRGRIVKKDIENFDFRNPVASSSQMKINPEGQEKTEQIPHSQMRKVIAKRLVESKFTAPHYYLNVEYDMDRAISFRDQYNSLPDTKISFNDLVIKASALSIKQHLQINSQWKEDRIFRHQHVHIGVAVAVPDGLVVPVLKFADEMTMTQIGHQVKDLAQKARDKKLQPSEMEGSTFTISNLGMFGIESFTSIINQPNSVILSVGTIVQKPVVKNGQIQVGHTMKLTLACDHRVVDGATGAAFLQTLRGYIENPVTILAWEIFTQSKHKLLYIEKDYHRYRRSFFDR